MAALLHVLLEVKSKNAFDEISILYSIDVHFVVFNFTRLFSSSSNFIVSINTDF